MRPDQNLQPLASCNQLSPGLGASDLVRDRFLANICHELRTPINGVIGMLELLRDTRLDGDQQMYASTAQRSAEHLLSLIEELLDLSLLESGMLALQESSFDLRSELLPLVEAQVDVARQHNCNLRVSCSIPEGARAVGDTVRLRQLVSSLLDSTLKSNPQIDVELSLDAAIESGGWWRLRLALGNLAGPLQCNADGLAWRFTQSLAEHLGTRIELDEGYGYSTFKLTLDLPAAPDSLAGMRMLFVADDEHQCRFIETGLTQGGVRADGFTSAGDALKALKQAALAQDPYRIVLLGRNMHGIDGELLGRAIIADQTHRATRFVLLAVDEASGDARPAPGGFAALLRKPFTVKTLLDTLSALASADEGEPHPAASAVPRTFSGNRVLVADDHVVNQQIAARMLAKFGCEVEVAGDGRTAVAMHEVRGYDLILMDCQMPGMDGYQATARIRALESGGKRTPIVGWTAFALQEERQRCLGAGMDDFMTKPLRPRPLHDMLQKWLRAAEVPLPPPDAPAPEDEVEAIRVVFGPDFADLANLFLRDSPQRLEAIRAAAAVNDAAQLVRLAHSFAGSTASIGANRLSLLCRTLETEARNGAMDRAAEALDAIDKEFARLETRLNAMIARKEP
jgi:CheY-like chemotaxis protein/HPt (histidine-containing phosphotransfer) domain-containing protein